VSLFGGTSSPSSMLSISNQWLRTPTNRLSIWIIWAAFYCNMDIEGLSKLRTTIMLLYFLGSWFYGSLGRLSLALGEDRTFTSALPYAPMLL
jgi:hypothetical protein